jgi:hypothetical protein
MIWSGSFRRRSHVRPALAPGRCLPEGIGGARQGCFREGSLRKLDRDRKAIRPEPEWRHDRGHAGETEGHG